MSKKLFAVLAVLVISLTAVAPVGAITGGQPDGDRHPYGALLLVPGVTFCSGTLIDEDVVLTAGHCTYGAEHVEIWFQSDLEPTPSSFGYPFTGQVSGTPYTQEPRLANPEEVARALQRAYPPLLRDAGIGGTVVLWLYVNEEGRVVKVQVNRSSGYAALDEAALSLAPMMVFTPAAFSSRTMVGLIPVTRSTSA